MYKFFSTILVIICLSPFCEAQQITRFTETQLLDLQNRSLQDINTFLTNAGWKVERNQDNKTMEYFDYYLDFQVERWTNPIGDWQGNIFVYYKFEIPNLIIYQTLPATFDQIQGKTTTQRRNSFKKTIIQKRNGITLECRDYFKDKIENRYFIFIYNGQSLNYLIETERTRIEAEKERIRVAQEDVKKRKLAERDALKRAETDRLIRYNNAFTKGNDLFKLGKFKDAIDQFELAKRNLLPTDNQTTLKIDSLIQRSKKDLRQQTFEDFIKNGDEFYRQEKYELSLLNYTNALSIDRENTSVGEKIKMVKKYLNIIEIQKTEQTYSSINPNDFLKFRDANYDALNSLMKYATNEGKLSYTSVIKFDYLGNNQSNLKINEISDNKMDSYLKAINFMGIPPSRILKYYIPSKEVLNFNLTWETNKIIARVKSQNIAIHNGGLTYYKYNDKIVAYINNQNYRNGNYIFEVIEKNLNGVGYQDLNLIAYHYNSGPMKFLYSMCLPGWGTKKVSNNQKGKGKMIFFLITSAISVACKIHSDNQYELFKKEPYSANNYYQVANDANKIFLVTGGLAAGIYICDILYVLGKGLRNNNKSRALKNKLREGSVSLVNSPYKP